VAIALRHEQRTTGAARRRKAAELSFVSSGSILFQGNWLPPSDCEHLISLHKRFWNPKTGQSYDGNKLIDVSLLTNSAKVELYLWELAQKVRKRIQNFFGVNELFIESLFLVALVEGGFHHPHADNERYVRKSWVPNHTPHRDYSTILYLNSDFRGGDLCFAQRKICISPTRGSLVAFPSNGDFLHSVRRVTSGIRYSMPIWFTKNRRFAVWEQ